ncbi:MAG: coproporphyrinogen-III oxidase family protein [Candidatus Altiarchaeota archaeon]
MDSMTHSRLAAQAGKRYIELGLGEGLEAVRRTTRAFESSHIIVTYPPYQALDPINHEEIGAGGRDIALYVHIPYCLNKCAYCHYVSDVAEDEKEQDRYVDYLKKEVELVSRIFNLKDKRVGSVHIGGGTPTTLKTPVLIELIDKVKEHFRVDEKAEVTLESCPKSIIRRVGEGGFGGLIDKGVSRLSIGIQSFNNKVLNIAGRKHTGRQAKQSVKLARDAGFGNINVDMMIGLPGQDTSNIHRDLEYLSMLEPESLTLYHLRLKSSVPMYDLLMEDSGRFPDIESSLTMDLMYRTYLDGLGYHEDPVNWFNKQKKYEYRHQLDKWGDKTDLVALGVAGYSHLNNTQYYNHCRLEDYYNMLDQNRPPVHVGKKIPAAEQGRRHVIFRIKTRAGVDKKEYAEKYGASIDEEFAGILQTLAEQDLIHDTQDHVRLTDKGILFADEIARLFYSPEVDQRLGQ